MNQQNRIIGLAIATLSLSAFVIALARVDWSPADLFFTPDQRGQWLLDRGDYAGAAALFASPMRRGAAQYRNGDFRAAATAFGQVDSPEAFYNRANAELMQGNYEAAIAAYRQALADRPHWRQARDNLQLAQRRQQRLNPANEGDQGTGGKLEADEIVFDNKAANARQRETVSGGESALSDAALRAMWLRRVQTRPADFLRAKFRYQASHSAKTEKTVQQPAEAAP